MPDTVDTDVTVVGAGITGLATAHYLVAGGADVRVLEKSERLGGTIETKREGEFLVDCGPNSALDTTPLLDGLFRDLGIAGSRVDASDEAKNRYIVRDGRLHALPLSPPGFIKSGLFSPSAKLRLLREPFVRPARADADETLASFVERRLGREMLDYAINPFVSGVYAGRPEQLSVRAAFPRLHELEQRYGSLIKGAIKGRRERTRRERTGEASRQSARMFSFDTGMQAIVRALGDEIGDAAHTGARITGVRMRRGRYEVDAGAGGRERTFRSRALVFAIPAYALAAIPFEFDFAPATALAGIPYPPVAVVFFGYRSAPASVALDGFGFLVPEKERRWILGTIWSSTLFPGRAPSGGVALTAFVGGSRQPELARLPEDELVEIVRRDLEAMMGITAAPDHVTVKRWDRAIPQYTVGHADLVRLLEEFEARTPGFHVAGNFRGGVSVGDCVKRAHALAGEVGEALRSAP